MIGGLVDGPSFFVVGKPRDQGRAAANGKAENAPAIDDNPQTKDQDADATENQHRQAPWPAKSSPKSQIPEDFEGLGDKRL